VSAICLLIGFVMFCMADNSLEDSASAESGEVNPRNPRTNIIHIVVNRLIIIARVIKGYFKGHSHEKVVEIIALNHRFSPN
jgi:hypothetical protein